MIEKPGIEAPATNKIIIEEVNLNLKNYEVDNNFTAKLSSDFNILTFGNTKYLDFVLLVEKENDSKYKARNVKLYITPSKEFTIRTWILISK